jgi:NAD(P)-dependent dehydrogenase (short-subunit alcohol dehydrogenase family)
MDELSMQGKVAIVTGSSSGIGRAIAERLGTRGAEVYLSGRSSDALEASRERIESVGERPRRVAACTSW